LQPAILIHHIHLGSCQQLEAWSCNQSYLTIHLGIWSCQQLEAWSCNHLYLFTISILGPVNNLRRGVATSHIFFFLQLLVSITLSYVLTVQLSLSAGCPKTQSSEHCAIIIILFDTVGYAVKILRVKEKILNLDKNNFLATTCQCIHI